MDKIEKIKEWVNKQKKEELARNSIGVITGKALFVDANELLSFLDTLSEEPDKGLEEAAEEWAENEAYGKSDAEFEMAYKGFIAGWEYRSECEKSSIMGDLLKNILKVGVQHNSGFGPDLKQCKDNEDESK